MPADVQRLWLDWARPIVRMSHDRPEHFSWCAGRIGGKASDKVADASLRWPGYVGRNWQRRRGVLFVGSVHTDFRGRGGDVAAREPVVESLVAANARWRDLDDPSEQDDRDYLEATATAYEQLIPFWSRGDLLSEVAAAVTGDADEPLGRSAWVNLAHCRIRPRSTKAEPLQRACSGREGCFPLADVVHLLQPAVILCPIKPMAGDHGGGFDFVPTGRPMPFRPQVRIVPGAGAPVWNGEPASSWVPALADALR